MFKRQEDGTHDKRITEEQKREICTRLEQQAVHFLQADPSDTQAAIAGVLALMALGAANEGMLSDV